MKIAEIVIANNSRPVDRLFHYLVPPDMTLLTGMRVLVPFGRGDRTETGVVVGFTEQDGDRALKSVSRIVDERPLFSEASVALAKWMQETYLCTFFQALKTVMPSGISVKTTRWVTLVRRPDAPNPITQRLEEAGGTADFALLADIPNIRTKLKALLAEGVVVIDETSTQSVKTKTIRMAHPCGEPDMVKLHKVAPKQARMLDILRQTGAIAVADLVAFSQGSYAAVTALHQKGFIRFEDRAILRQVYSEESFQKTVPLTPTPEQEAALSYLKAAADSGDRTPVLLHGVTGSGKTEVFLQIIDYILAKGKQAIVLVPEISLTPQMVERFVGRFGALVSVLHSGLSLGERYDEWIKIRSGKVRVAVGARSAVFAPFENLGVIVVDEEHEHTYKSESAPFYHAREVAVKRGENEGAMVILSSATPSIPSYYHALQGRYKLIEMPSRTGSADMPSVEIVDMRRELYSGNKNVFSRRLLAELEYNVKNGQQAILFHNRRGFNSFVLCRSCGEALACQNCSVTLTYHKHTERLKCHYCGFERDNVSVCPSCGSPHIRYMGMGTERIEEEIARLFGAGSFIRMDGDTTAGKNSHEVILRRFARENIPILLGTQMVTKGLDFPNVTLVGVMLADLSLNIDDFRAAEQTFSQLTQVCGRAGRGSVSGRAVVQTYQPDHYALTLAQSHDYAAFYSHEIAIREQLGYPPFSDIVMILMQGETLASVATELKDIAARLRGVGGKILGPVPAPYAKIKNKYRWRILLKLGDVHTVMPLLHKILTEYKGANRLTIDINPNNMN